MRTLLIITSFVILTCINLFAQEHTSVMKRDVQFLSDDALAGRMTGSDEAAIAAGYIAGRMAEIGLEPAGSSYYFQEFNYVTGRSVSAKSFFSVNEKPLMKGWQVLSPSSDGAFAGDLIDAGYGIVIPEENYNDYAEVKVEENQILLIKLGSPEGWNPHSKYYPYAAVHEKLDIAAIYKPAAVIFIGEDVGNELLGLDLMKKTLQRSFPVVYLDSALELENGQRTKVNGDLQLLKTEEHCRNVVGFLDNGSSKTVVLGGHYDHLGMGELGSLNIGEAAIHNGADDNASGIAMILSLAEELVNNKDFTSNLLVLAFTGEELGLYGSNYFANNSTVALEGLKYMLNFDMVGRLDMDKGLAISGTGTSPSWSVLDELSTQLDFKLNLKESGIGPSDHTSFYLQDIPVLHLFTGAHEDYHKPSDDEDKINYDGMAKINSLVLDMISALDNGPELVFTKTAAANNQDQAPRFTVTLGVIPDYLFSGKGMRIEGIRNGKTAAKAGMLKGDIVTAMDANLVSDMMTYMAALSEYKKGSSAEVKVNRDGEEITFKIVFE